MMTLFKAFGAQFALLACRMYYCLPLNIHTSITRQYRFAGRDYETHMAFSLIKCHTTTPTQ